MQLNRLKASSQTPARRTSVRRALGRSLQIEPLESRQMMAYDFLQGLGVVGDDISDEYAPRNYSGAQSWTELLQSQAGLNLGLHNDNWNDLRGNGSEFNWSVTGGTSLDVQLSSSTASLQQQVISKAVSHAVIAYGRNDFSKDTDYAFNSSQKVYPLIYNGGFTAADATSFANYVSTGVLSSIFVLGTSTDLRLVVATIPDPGDSPAYRAAFPIAANRAKVTAVIQETNALIRDAAAAYQLPVVDLYGLSKALTENGGVAAANRSIGGVNFNVTAAGGVNAPALFTQDGYHPHTAMQGIIANAILTGFNKGYGDQIPLLSEQQIVSLSGQTYTANTLNLNYANYVSVSPMSVLLDFGDADDAFNSFKDQINAYANASGGAVAPFTDAELTTLKQSIQNSVQAAFAGRSLVVTSDVDAVFGNFQTIQYGTAVNQLPAGRNAVIGDFEADWTNQTRSGAGFVAPAELGTVLTGMNLLSRAAQLDAISKALSFYSVQGIGLSLGLDHADALGRPDISPANYAATGGVQNLDYMSGNPALGFDTSVFKSNAQFIFSPLAKAKLDYALAVNAAGVKPWNIEATAAHATQATAQLLTLQAANQLNSKSALVRKAGIDAAGQVDLYAVDLPADARFSAQTAATGVYLPTSLNTRIRILAADGTTVLAASDDTLLGPNSFGVAGTSKVDDDSLVLNFRTPTAGRYYVEVTGVGATTGDYDLFLATIPATLSGGSLWTNPLNPLNIDGSGATLGDDPVPLDALIIINELNNRQFSDPTGLLRAPDGTTPPPYYDPTGDGYVVALDALVIINFLNAAASSSFAGSSSINVSEGEASADATTGSIVTAAPLDPASSERETSAAQLWLNPIYQPTVVDSTTDDAPAEPPQGYGVSSPDVYLRVDQLFNYYGAAEDSSDSLPQRRGDKAIESLDLEAI